MSTPTFANSRTRRVCSAAMRVFPRTFRDHFAQEMFEQLALDYEEARKNGGMASFVFAFASAFDLLRSACAERINPTMVEPYSVREQRMRMPSMLENWTRELRHAVRSLRRSAGFTVVTVLTLGLAIGANAGMFSVVNRVLLDPLPYANPERLVHIAASAPGSDLPDEFGVSAEFYLQYKEQSHLLQNVAAYDSYTSTFRAGDRAERIGMSSPTNTLYATLGVKPVLGRIPVDADDDKAVLISYGMWTSWFANDSSVIGRAYDVSGAKRTVVGVMPRSFNFPGDRTQVWISSPIRAQGLVPGRFGEDLIARMAPGTTPEAVARELTALSKRLPERFGGSANYAKIIGQHRAIVRGLEEQMLGSVAKPLRVLLGAVALVLLIACANVVNLFNVRAEGRQRDLAVRRALGAARGQLVRLQIAEALVVAALAGAFAITLAFVGLPVLLHAAPSEIPRIGEVRIDAATVLFTFVAALLSALACAAVPALRASTPELSRLREGGRGATRGRRWTRDALVVAQTSLALVLLIGSGLLVRSFWELKHVNPGYNTKDVFTFQIAPDNANLTDSQSFARFDLEFMDRLRALPGVQAVGLVENVPLNENTSTAHFKTEGVVNADDAGTMLNYTFTAGDYFKVMGIKLIAGRMFTNDEQLSASNAVIVSKAAAKKLWPGQDPIGKRILRSDLTQQQTVIGVVDDVLQLDFRDQPDPLVYLSLTESKKRTWIISSPAYVVKTPRAAAIAPEIRAIIHDVAPTAPMYRIFTMEGLQRDSMVQLSFTMLTLGIASMLALILGAIGLYGVLSYVVAERTREIGVRMALGARSDQVRRMVVAQGARVVAVGVALGTITAIVSTRLLGSLLFGVAALDVLTFVSMAGSMVAVGLLASYVPARRASKVDPIVSLRSE